MRRYFLLLTTFSFITILHAQVSINTTGTPPDASAMLDIKSTNKGFLPPRMSWTQIKSIPNPATGLVVFDEGIKALRMYDGSKWLVIGVKESLLTDPPGNFSTFAVTGTAGSGPIDGKNGRVCVIGTIAGTLILGNDTLNSNGANDVLMAMFDTAGNYLWARSFGNANDEYAQDIAMDQSGNVYISGYFSGVVDFDPGPGVTEITTTLQSLYFAKYNSEGDFIWVKHLTPSNDFSSYPWNIAIDESGSIFISGYFSGSLDFDPGPGTQTIVSFGSFDAFFAKYDLNGNWVWSKRIGGIAAESYPSILLLNGTIVLAGSFSGTADFDPTSAVSNLTSVGSSDLFLARYDALGNLLWAKRLGSAGSESFPFISKDVSGGICLAANFSGTLDIDPDAGTINLISTGSNDIFIAKYSSSGTFLSYGFKIGGGSNENVQDVQTDDLGNVYVIGRYEGTVDFDINAGVLNLTSLGGADGFIAKYSPTAGFVFAASMGGPAFDGPRKLLVNNSGKIVFVTGNVDTSPWITFNGQRLYETGFAIIRYEEE